MLFSDGSLMLISEREGDAILGLLWAAGAGRASSNSSAPVLVNATHLQQGFRSSGAVWKLARSVSSKWSVPDGPATLNRLGVKELVGMQVFGGATEFLAPTEREELHRLMRRRRETAEALVEIRGRSSMFSRSDLEIACEDVPFDGV